ncbi:HAMP domain-containing sensor histidine kinase [uncultured Vagococcus sp.]|uniref:HAMP domain-containing sensor histidine kinase n=1 Tax=uncultured Vagococcus sp. TaxID=189676 RepID=UPI0028D1A065|nr:HAMP domain-containing sensor histidine kinase [uncultured Vagococcus sp.]
MKKQRTLRTQLLFSFLLISLLLVGFLSLITINLMNTHFAKYVDDKYADTLIEYQHRVETAFNPQTNDWYQEEIVAIGEQASMGNVLMTVIDQHEQLIWSTETNQGSGRHHMMQDHCAQAVARIDKTNSDYVETSLPLTVNNQTLGKVTFGYYGALKYTTNDLQFMRTMKRNLAFIFILALPLSLLLASLIARQISRPLITVNQLTKKVAQGDYSQHIELATPITEISELIHSVNELTQRLDSQDMLRKKMSTDIAHEIRTPLTTLQGNVEAMIDGIWDVTPDRLQTCHEEILRLTRLVASIERISRLEEQQEPLLKSSFNLLTLSQHIANNFNAALSEKELTFNIQGNSALIVADQDQLSQVLTNLLSNAIKFTPAKGTITLKITSQPDHLILVVSDSGIGLSPEEVPLIFDRFYMADKARNRKIEGQGIGLAVVKSIVDAHGGTIRVESSPKGTSFTITLPRN